MLAQEYPVIETASSCLRELTEDEKFRQQKEAREDQLRRINGLIRMKERAEKETAEAKKETAEAKQETAEAKKETAVAKKEIAETKKKITEVKETADQGVINMLADSMPIDQICRYSGYSPERVSELAKANKISLMQ